VLRPLRLGEAERKRSIHQKNYGGCDEDGDKNLGFGHDDRAENAKIADCGKPQPIDQEASGGAQQSKADPKDNDGNEERA
jgi:hypothetical protein